MHFSFVSLLLLPLLAGQGVAAAGIVGAKKFADVDDCSGAVAFSSVGAVVKDSKLTFNSGLVDKSIGWSKESGEFTCHCPGLYQLAFSGAGDPQSSLTLRKKPFKEESWADVISTGAGGGASITLLEMELGDQVAVFLGAGKLAEESGKAPTSAFSGFRIAKK